MARCAHPNGCGYGFPLSLKKTWSNGTHSSRIRKIKDWISKIFKGLLMNCLWGFNYEKRPGREMYRN